ncbi:ABC transporter permease [Microvirga sp. STR05]|uniref:ABC transporter permease n=1 Tax=Hymenobacter duratus TaxID=2771356 RepID=A0ABR8JCR2_9BACT|nr:ABC transporter permease [Hymenobacter duratus]MBD2714592.1 ABC transporter permease [Hymenobacter duratus]MBR7949496.1 ABC transporter permease [Microvirga sp. STR05]
MTSTGLRTKRNWSWHLSLGWLLLLAAAALLADLFSLPTGPDLLRSNAAPLTPGHLLGTDSQGQDVLRGMLYGARTALLVSIPTTLLASALGTALGVAAGYWGNTRLRIPKHWLGSVAVALIFYIFFAAPANSVLAGWWPWCTAGGGLLLSVALSRFSQWRTTVALPVDSLVSAAIVFLAALPRLLLVVLVATAVTPSVTTLVLLLTLTFWVPTARLIRAEVRRIRWLPYLEAAVALGLPAHQILLRHVLPNCWHVVRTAVPLSLAILISLETTLSFLGVGLPPELPSWGRLLAAGRIAPSCWWLIVFPTIALLLTALSLRRLVAAPEPHSRVLQAP